MYILGIYFKFNEHLINFYLMQGSLSYPIMTNNIIPNLIKNYCWKSLVTVKFVQNNSKPN